MFAFHPAELYVYLFRRMFQTTDESVDFLIPVICNYEHEIRFAVQLGKPENTLEHTGVYKPKMVRIVLMQVHFLPPLDICTGWLAIARYGAINCCSSCWEYSPICAAYCCPARPAFAA